MKFLVSALLAILLGLVFPLAYGATTAPELLSDAKRPFLSGSGNSFSPTFSAGGQFVTFVSQAQDIVTNGTPSRFLNILVRNLDTATTSLVSVNSSGIGGGNEDSNFPTISSNGQFVAFESFASNLIPGDTNKTLDVFVRDLNTGTTALVNVNTNGANSLGYARSPVISANGQRIVFNGNGSDLVTNEFNPPAGTLFVRDLYVRDLPSERTSLITVNFAGTGSARSTFNNTTSDDATISADGRFVAFWSNATNLVAGFTNRNGHIFIRDIDGAVTIWASAGVADVLTNFPTGYRLFSPQISGDGNTVLFLAQDSSFTQLPVLISFNRLDGTSTLLATNIGYGTIGKISANGRFVTYQSLDEVWVTDLATGAREMVCDASVLPGVSACTAPDISADGRRVAFLGAASTNGPWSAYVYDRDSSTRSLISLTTNGAPATVTPQSEPAISPDGKQIALESGITELVPNDANASSDIFVRDIDSASTMLLSETAVHTRTGAHGHGSLTQRGAVSEFGRFIAFTSLNNELVDEDENPWQDVFVSDRTHGTNQLIQFPGTANQVRLAFAPALSTNGRYIAWFEQPVPQSSGTALTTNLYWMDRETGVARSIGFGGTTYPSATPALSPDGKWLAFPESLSTSGITNLYIRDISQPAATNVLISVNLAGVPTRLGHSTAPVFSRDGQWIAFGSHATDLTTNFAGYGGALPFPLLLARNLQAGRTHWVSSTPANSPPLIRGSRNPVFSADGRFIVFEGLPFLSPPGNLYRHDLKTTNSNILICSSCSNPSMNADGRIVAFEQKDALSILQVFVRDLLTGQTTLISSNSASGNRNSHSPQVSSDGRYTVFTSLATNLVSDDTNNVTDIFVYDRLLGSTFLLSRGPDGQPGDGPSTNPVLAPDGRTIVFTSFANNLASNDFNYTRDVFVLRLGGPDTDADGMDDEWELTYFDNLDRDGSLDSDSDGWSDLEEYRAGTNPTNGSSVLKILSSTHALGGTVIITWNSEPGRRYRIQYKQDMSALVWTDLPGLTTATGTTSVSTDTTTAGEPRRFYRVVLDL